MLFHQAKKSIGASVPKKHPKNTGAQGFSFLLSLKSVRIWQRNGFGFRELSEAPVKSIKLKRPCFVEFKRDLLSLSMFC
jgi:hypothetical protein